jgi:hypothetical protein
MNYGPLGKVNVGRPEINGLTKKGNVRGYSKHRFKISHHAH